MNIFVVVLMLATAVDPEIARHAKHPGPNIADAQSCSHSPVQAQEGLLRDFFRQGMRATLGAKVPEYRFTQFEEPSFDFGCE